MNTAIWVLVTFSSAQALQTIFGKANARGSQLRDRNFLMSGDLCFFQLNDTGCGWDNWDQWGPVDVTVSLSDRSNTYPTLHISDDLQEVFIWRGDNCFSVAQVRISVQCGWRNFGQRNNNGQSALPGPDLIQPVNFNWPLQNNQLGFNNGPSSNNDPGFNNGPSVNRGAGFNNGPVFNSGWVLNNGQSSVSKSPFIGEPPGLITKEPGFINGLVLNNEPDDINAISLREFNRQKSYLPIRNLRGWPSFNNWLDYNDSNYFTNGQNSNNGQKYTDGNQYPFDRTE